MFPCAACHGISPRPHSIVYQAVLIVLGSRLKHVTDNLVARLRRRDCGFRARITVTKDYVVFSSSLFERSKRAGPVWQQIPPTPLRILTTFFLSARGSPGRDKKKSSHLKHYNSISLKVRGKDPIGKNGSLKIPPSSWIPQAK